MTQTEGSVKETKEAYAYTPGLKVKWTDVVRKDRNIPISGDVHVKVGDIVDFKTKIAETLMPGDPTVINAAAVLGVEPENMENYMKKKEGDKVSEGEKICGFDAFFGLWKNWVLSPLDGVIETISFLSGQIVLVGDPIPLLVDSYISGKIVEVFKGKGAVVETTGAIIQGIFGVGEEAHGEIKVLVEDPNDPLTLDLITPDCSGKVIVGGSLISKEAIQKAIETGVAGIVVGGIEGSVLEGLLGYEIGVAITGHENIGVTLIVTEGLGEMAMNPRTLNLLKEFEGEMAAINGATQIRAGVLRPEIIIPHNKVSIQSTGEIYTSGMKPGTPIRIIREPYFGALGIVAGLPVELDVIESESKVRILEVELEDGEIVQVPRANVEIIEV